MNWVEYPLRRSGICDCGYSCVKDEILLGTICQLDIDTVSEGSMTCGGCRNTIRISVVVVVRDGTLPGLMPMGLFEVIQ